MGVDGWVCVCEKEAGGTHFGICMQHQVKCGLCVVKTAQQTDASMLNFKAFSPPTSPTLQGMR